MSETLVNSESSVNNETLEAKPQFKELLNFVIECTLSDPSVFTQQRNAIKSKTLATVLRPHKHWLTETSLNKPPRNTKETPNAHELTPTRLIIETEVQDDIEALGRAILDEAFLCLGDDAPEMAEKFQRAKTLEEELTICHWLIHRMEQISENAALNHDELSSNDNPVYHPLRLSPKTIGSFPDIRVEPTCLGYSILAASFFEKAGAPYLHAGVVYSAYKEAAISLTQTAQYLTYLAEKNAISLPDTVISQLQYAIESAEQASIEGNDGFHTAILVKLSDNTWRQLDPNFGQNAACYPEQSRQIEKAYQSILSHTAQSKGMEYLCVRDLDTTALSYFNAIIDLDITPMPSVAEIMQFLQHLPLETAYAEIMQKYFLEQIIAKNHMFNREKFLDLNIARYCRFNHLNPYEYLQDTIYTTLLEYVFTDASQNEDFIASIKRCKTDQAYCRRRAEDLLAAPYIWFIKLQSNYSQIFIDNRFQAPHFAMEVGSPAYRIGACVLSDFASYCGDKLPLSFWMAYWPSAVSFLEHYINDMTETTSSQHKLKEEILKDFSSVAWFLRYYKINTILSMSNE